MLKTIVAAIDQLLRLNQVALLVLALTLISIPECRTDDLRHLLKGLFLVEAASLVWRARNRGSLSPEAMVDGLASGRLKPLTTTLERCAVVAAMVATVVLAFS